MKSWLFGIAFVMVAVASMAGAQEAPPVSRWGAADEVGAANHLTPQGAVNAARLVRTGKTYRLGIVVDADTPAYPPRYARITVLQPTVHGHAQGAGSNRATDNDDMFTGWLGVGSQIDGLGHVGVNHVYYNGAKAEDFARATGLTRFGVHNLPAIVTRGVMLDMARFYGVEMVPEGKAYSRADIERAARAQGVIIGRGDVVLFHSGWLNLLDGPKKDLARYAAAEPGPGMEAASYLASLGVVAVGADTWGMEAIPAEDPTAIVPVHQTLLARHGVYILENMDTRELARDDVHEFMFVLGAARMRGSVQMMINPIAIR